MESVVVLGATNVDLVGVPDSGELRPATSNPGRVTVSPGGVGRNIAENLARLGVPTILLSAVSDDRFGELALDRCREAGVEVSGVERTERTERGYHSIYLALHDGNGELIAGVSDMSATELFDTAYVDAHREQIRRAGILVLDANLPRETLQRALQIANSTGVRVVVEPVSVPKAAAIASLTGDIFAATPNGAEARLLADKETIEHLLVTRGKRGVAWYRRGNDRCTLYPVDEAASPHTNGAGDAFAAGVVAAFARGVEIEEAVRWGIAAARITLTTPETTSPTMDARRLKEELEEWK